ncbi:hypothetical protein BH09BAC1_BH09BAC1_22520 [soil metagenome]
MSKLIVLLVFVFTSYLSFPNTPNLFARVTLSDEKKDGYGVEMYYLLPQMALLQEQAQKIEQPTERNLLSIFGIPLVETGSGFDPCIREKPHFTNADLFKGGKVYGLEINRLRMTVTLAYWEVNYCKFDLDVKYWNSYDIHFAQAIVINKRLKRHNIEEEDKIHLENVMEILSDKNGGDK